MRKNRKKIQKKIPDSKFGHLEWKFSRISGFGGGKTQKKVVVVFFRILYWAPLARPSKGSHDLAISGRGSAKMSQKCEKNRNFFRKIFPESKFGHLEWKFSRICGFGGEKTQKKVFFFRILYWAPLARPSRGAHDLAISGRGSAKIRKKKCEKIELGRKIWPAGVEIQPTFWVCTQRKASSVWGK